MQEPFPRFQLSIENRPQKDEDTFSVQYIRENVWQRHQLQSNERLHATPSLPLEATVVGIFDGHGGGGVSRQLASNSLLPIASASLSRGPTGPAYLIPAVYRDWELDLLKRFGPTMTTMGSTATVLSLTPSAAFVAVLGDSQCIVYVKNDAESMQITPKQTADSLEERMHVVLAGGHISYHDPLVGRMPIIIPREHINLSDANKLASEEFCDSHNPSCTSTVINNAYRAAKQRRIAHLNDRVYEPYYTVRVGSPHTTFELGPTRAFGDTILKHPHPVVRTIPQMFSYNFAQYPQKDLFFIMATDGFWDFIQQKPEQIAMIRSWIDQLMEENRHNWADIVRTELMNFILNTHEQFDDITIAVVHVALPKESGMH